MMVSVELPLDIMIIGLSDRLNKNFDKLLSEFDFVRLHAEFNCCEQALKYVDKNRVDVIFIDILAIYQVGLILVLDLANGMNQDVAIVFLTTQNDYLINREFDACGFYYVEKPVDQRKIKNILQKIISDRTNGEAKAITENLLEKISS